MWGSRAMGSGQPRDAEEAPPSNPLNPRIRMIAPSAWRAAAAVPMSDCATSGDQTGEDPVGLSRAATRRHTPGRSLWPRNHSMVPPTTRKIGERLA